MTTGPRPRPLLKPPLSPDGWSRAAAVLLALGLISTGLLLGVDSLREKLVAEDFGLIRAADDIQAGLATSHLWMEQYVAGDPIPPADLWRGIDRSSALSQTMLRGGEIAEGEWRIRRVVDPRLRRAVEQLEKEISLFAESSLRRQTDFESGRQVGVGSAVDRDYDALFSRVASQVEALRRTCERRLSRRQAQFRLYSRALMLAWIVIVGVAFTGFRRFESKRRRAEVALRDRDNQLVQAQKMEAVGRLAGGIAHDINNYLGAIRVNCDLVSRRPLPVERTIERMASAISAINKARDLIGRLLAIGRRQPAQPAVINLNRSVESLTKIMRQHLGERVELETHLAPDLWNIEIDPSQVEQILVNLLVNAREAMPDGGRLVIESSNTSFDGADRERRPVTVPGEYVMLAVSDTGIGIEPELLDKVFEPFFTTKEGSSNSGLGLATVYGIVKQNGGNVWAYSETGRGTTFRIYLPRCVEAGASEVQSETRAPGLELDGSAHILLVEDNSELRDSTRALLESFGYRVTAVPNGASALAVFEQGEVARIDLVISDVVMRGMNGPEVVEEIERRYGRLPVIFVSGYSESVVGFHGMLRPGVNFLGKPFASETLLRKVREALAGARPATGTPYAP